MTAAPWAAASEMRILSSSSQPRSPVRPVRYAAVAALGAVVQGVVVVTGSQAGWPPVLTTAAAIEAAILHNFAWHDRWTWGDRRVRGPAARLERLIRYNAAMAMTSLAIGTGVAWLATARFGWPLLAANGAAVAIAAVANYVVSDLAVFRARPRIERVTARGSAGSHATSATGFSHASCRCRPVRTR